jgi:hypothetical protein
MEIKDKYRTIEVSGKRIVSTDWKHYFLVEDDFNEKDFDWDKFFGVRPITHQNDGKGENGVPSTYSGEITDVVEGEEYSETSSHNAETAPNRLITKDGKCFHTKGVKTSEDGKHLGWTKKILDFIPLTKPYF